jgi:hypothetical protein
MDSRIFWTILYSGPIAWILLAILAVFRLEASWFLVTVVAISMSMANLIGSISCDLTPVLGYTKCEKDYKKKAAAFVTEQGFVQSFIGNSITSRLFG